MFGGRYFPFSFSEATCAVQACTEYFGSLEPWRKFIIQASSVDFTVDRRLEGMLHVLQEFVISHCRLVKHGL